jgi:hypothetical protein
VQTNRFSVPTDRVALGVFGVFFEALIRGPNLWRFESLIWMSLGVA